MGANPAVVGATDINQAEHCDLMLLKTIYCPQQLQNRSSFHQESERAFGASIMATGSAPPLTKLLLNYVLEPMRSLDASLDYYSNDFWLEHGDERSSRLPFMAAGPWKLVYATLIYLYVIKFLLPNLMAKRQRPFELKWLIRLYNLSMVLSNIYAFYHGARLLNFGIKTFGCEIIDHTDYRPGSLELLHYGYLFLLSRLIEWLDTIFFVLRKKQNQVTKLHVFHHSFVPALCWVYLKFHPGYTVAFFPFINTFVHTIMYMYYFLATFGPSVQPYLWWKKYLTSLQIAQFVLILIQLATIPLSTNEKCQYPRGFLYVAFSGAILFLWLFYTYYLDTYKLSRKAASSAGIAAAQRQAGDQPKLQANNSKSKASVKLQNGREGSSRALSDTIDNAIVCDKFD